MHNSKERHDAPKCHADTRKAVIKDITSWASDDSKDTLILWISAPAGSGKSAILQTIAELFHASKGLTASFFFSRTAPQRQTETYLVATIAAQLAMSIPSTRPFIEQVVLDDFLIFDKTLQVQMELLIIQPLICASLQTGCSTPWPSLLIIDGVDECTGCKVQANILYMLSHALLQLKTSLPKLCLLIASRPEPTICDVFEDKLSNITHHLVLDNSYNPDQDIATFLRSSFADIYHRRHTRFPSMSSLILPWPSEDIISFLVRRSSGQFIFAATVIRFIDEDRKLPTAQLEVILDICESLNASQHKINPFDLLDQLYTHVLRSSEEIHKVISLLAVIFYLGHNHNPTPAFLQSFLGLNPDEMILLFWNLHSIIYIPASRTDSIHFYHASFRDYLRDRHRSKDLYIDEHLACSVLLKSSMRHLSKMPLAKWQVVDDPVMQYSIKSWCHHYSRGDSIRAGTMDHFLETFRLNSDPLHYPSTMVRLVHWWEIYGRVQIDWHREVSTKFIWMILITPSHVFSVLDSAHMKAAPQDVANLTWCLTNICFHGLGNSTRWNQ